MAIKDILVFLDDGASNTQRSNTAFQLTKSHDAVLTGASLESMKPVHAKSNDEKAIARMADRMAHQLVEDFTNAASNTDLTVNTIVISGGNQSSALKMAHYARNADLVILGQPNPSRDNFLRLQNFAQEVMLLSGRPILFVPYIGSKEVPFKKAMIAWDGTPAASRTVHDAIPLLAQTKEVIILVVESKKQKEFKKELLVDGLVTHLSHHDINSKLVRINPGTNDVPTTILNQITENGIDLLVLGGYGTPTLKQKVFGSVSSTLLSSMIVPVLMSH